MPARSTARCCRLPASVAVLCSAVLGVAGCGRSCTATSLEVQPVKVASHSAPLDLHARLTTHGKALTGIRVAFFLLTTGPNNDVGHLIGYGTTDGNGTAAVTPSQSLDDALLPGEVATGVQAKFTSVVRIHGTSYCDAIRSTSLS